MDRNSFHLRHSELSIRYYIEIINEIEILVYQDYKNGTRGNSLKLFPPLFPSPYFRLNEIHEKATEKVCWLTWLASWETSWQVLCAFQKINQIYSYHFIFENILGCDQIIFTESKISFFVVRKSILIWIIRKFYILLSISMICHNNL